MAPKRLDALLVQLVRRTHTIDTLLQQATQGERISLELHQVPRDAELIRTALRHHLRITVLNQDTQCPWCGQVPDRICDRAAVCPRAGDGNRRHNALGHVFYEATQAAQKEQAGVLQPRPDSDGLPQQASLDRPADVWILRGKDMIPEALGFRGPIPVLRPATRSPGSATTPTRNLTEHETLKRTFHDTANRCQQNGMRFTPMVFDPHAGSWEDFARNLVIWISRRLSATTRDINLETGEAHLFVTPR